MVQPYGLVLTKRTHKLQLVQNFAARIVTSKKKFDHITPVLKELKWLPVTETNIILYRDTVMAYKCLSDKLTISVLMSTTMQRDTVLIYKSQNVEPH